MNASGFVRVGAYSLWDQMAKPVAKRPRQVPRSADALTTQWLTSVLCASHADAEVESFSITGGSDGTTSRRSIEVRYNAAGQRLQLPTKLFCKAMVNFKNRLMCGSIGLLANETGFYNDIRPALDIEAPRALYARHGSHSYRMFILFEDMASLRGCEFLSPRTYVTRSMAEDMVGLMVSLHAANWSSPILDRLPWLMTTEQWQKEQNEKIDLQKYSEVGIERARDVLPAAFYARKHEYFPALMKASAVSSRAPMTVVHSDIHIGNWYLTGKGRMGLCDWQAASKASWALDFGYAMGSALESKDRREWEEDLLRLYLSSLSDRGVSAPSFDQGWLAYRQQAFRGLGNWLPTLGAAGGMLPDMQPDEISLRNIQRMAQAVVDLGSLDAVKEA